MRYMYGWVFICLLMYACVQCTCVCMYVKVRGQTWGHFSDAFHLVFDMGVSSLKLTDLVRVNGL